MTATTRMHRINRGSAFRANTLHGSDSAQLDPFLGVDHAWMSAPTFPPHPHAGFSAVTYLFPDSETGIANRDSLGNNNLILPGGLHWTAAGRGVMHEENPQVSGRSTHLLQIFVNLPQDKQSAAPFMLSLAPGDVPVVQRPGARIRIPLGRFGSVQSPLAPPTDVTLLDISLEPGAELTWPLTAGEQAFFLPISGLAEINGVVFGLDSLLVPIIAATSGETTLRLVAGPGGAQVAVLAGKPLNQPVISNGPMAFVSPDSLATAVAAYQRGEFGHLK